MTEEDYNYRTSQTLLRNQFHGKGKLKIPIIPKFQEKAGDFDSLLLIGFDKTHLEDQNHLDRMVHFFLYDYRFERVWKNQTMILRSCPVIAQYFSQISVCIWKWRRLCNFTIYFATAGVALTGHPKRSGSSQRSTGAMNPPLISALRGSKKEVLLLSPPIWHLNTTITVTKRSGFWLATTRCYGAWSRRKSSAITRRFQRCREILFMWITSAVLGGI